jgi:DNA-binding NarL/FixJ family response regulator
MTKLTGRRILVVEDEALVAMLVEDALLDAGASVIGPAATVAEALAGLPGARADVVLVDLLDSSSEDQLIAQLRGVAPDARFLVYSGMPERTGATADGHLHKSVTFDELHRAIREVAAA